MAKIWMSAAAFVLAAAPALAGDDIMANYYGNTVVATGGMAETHSHYKADHTFDVTASAMGMDYVFKGTWSIKDGQLCRHYDDPTPPGLPGNPFCTPWDAHKVGDSWTASANGKSRGLTLKSGIF